MKYRYLVIMAITVVAAILSEECFAQTARPYHNGSVWGVSFIRIKPGMETAYLNYIATEWKRIQEAEKKEGRILSYKVLSTESHAPADWNLMLMVEYKDLATMEANEAKEDAMMQKLVGTDEKQRQGYRERLEIREIIQDRLAREVVLEPR